jgi:GWxTD domain-containing protein
MPLVAAFLLIVTFGVALVAYQSSETNRRPASAPLTATPSVTLSAPAPPKTKITATKPVLQLAQARPQQGAAPTTTIPAPWMKWLNEDVVYIVTDSERIAFRKLTTDQEREQFVENFWLSRDPTPGTPANEFKEEHYRRIAYANEHYSWRSGLPGWKTDRGRIYITYGPPDEIDSHPSGGSYERPAREGGGVTSTYPFEDWRYRYISGIGNDVNIEFVDKAMNGEYHMAMDPSEKNALFVK